jgi:exosortase
LSRERRGVAVLDAGSTSAVAARRTTSPATLILVCFLVVGLAVLYGQALIDLVADWNRDENYSHGVLIPPVVLWLVWLKRAESRRLVARPAFDGAALAGFGLALFIVGQAAVDFFLTRVSFVLVLTGLIVSLRGWQQLRVWAFPVALLALAIPLPTLILNEVSFPLQLLASRSGVGMLGLAGVPAFREGNLILLNGAVLEVAEACSGVRSLISLVTLVLVYGHLAGFGMAVRAALVVAVLPIVVFANALRVAGAGVAAHLYGPAAASGFLHSFSGWLFFGVSVILLFAVEQILVTALGRWRAPRLPIGEHS